MKVKYSSICSALAFISVFFLSTTVSNAQSCGSGLFNIELFILNESKTQEVHYDIYPMNTDTLEAIYSPNGNGEHILKRFLYTWETGTLIEAKYAERLLDTTSAVANAHLRRALYFTENKRSGKFMNSIITFSTIETYTVPYLIKFSSEDQTAWMMVHVFDGCDRTVALLWGDSPSLSIR